MKILKSSSLLPDVMCQNPSLDRVANARQETWTGLKSNLASLDINPNSTNIYIRCFKLEEIVELWVKDSNKRTFRLLSTYPFCVNSGILGPKRKEGDKQIPEGVYHITRFNPKSLFHLSLGLNYPNAADLTRADDIAPGSDIFLHGKCSSTGCIAVGDKAIQELYTIASVAKNHLIRVDIYPYKFNSERQIDIEIALMNQNFWTNLKTVYQDFENTREISGIDISESGEYIVNRGQ